MGRRKRREPVSLDELGERLIQTDLIPSQEPLRHEMAARLALLKEAGVSTIGELRLRLKSAASLEELAEASGVDAGYLGRLRRALGGFFPKPRSLKKFTWLDQEVVLALAEAGIKNTDYINQAAPNGVVHLEEEHGLAQGSLAEIAALSDLSQVQWVSPNFAGAMVAAGFQNAAALAAADPHDLYRAVAEANEDGGFYNGVVGERDIKRVI